MERIKELRNLKGLSQKELAKILGCNQTAVGKYERGQLEPNINLLNILANYFGCSIDYLVGREDDFGNVVVSGQTSDLTQKEKRLLQAFGKLPEQEQNKLIYDAEFYALRHLKQDQH